MAPTRATQASLTLSSPAFEPGSELPKRFTCDGENVSPPVSWSDVPATARSLALLVYDRDAGPALGASVRQGFVHWLVYNIPASLGGLPEGVPQDQVDTGQGIQTRNDFASSKGGRFPGGTRIRGMGYEGPCPPARHRYVFELMALDLTLALPADAPPAQVLKGLQGHVLAEGSFEVWYERTR